VEVGVGAFLEKTLSLFAVPDIGVIEKVDELAG
jgi:hypothetical protein